MKGGEGGGWDERQRGGQSEFSHPSTLTQASFGRTFRSDAHKSHYHIEKIKGSSLYIKGVTDLADHYNGLEGRK